MQTETDWLILVGGISCLISWLCSPRSPVNIKIQISIFTQQLCKLSSAWIGSFRIWFRFGTIYVCTYICTWYLAKWRNNIGISGRVSEIYLSACLGCNVLVSVSGLSREEIAFALTFDLIVLITCIWVSILIARGNCLNINAYAACSAGYLFDFLFYGIMQFLLLAAHAQLDTCRLQLRSFVAPSWLFILLSV